MRDWDGAIILTSHDANLVRMLETDNSNVAAPDEDGNHAVFAFQDPDAQLRNKLETMSLVELQAVCKASKIDVKGDAKVLSERYIKHLMDHTVLGTVGKKVLKKVEGGFDDYCNSISEFALLQDGGE